MGSPVEDQSWREDALCRQVDPDLWFPDVAGDNGETAKRICGLCPVQAECVEYALVAFERHGIWGGKSARELARTRVRRGMVATRPTPIPVERVWALADRGWTLESIAVALGYTPRTVERALKRRDENGAAA